jgi:NADPH-dependent 2,4-dienoyl-CoA reductase/sulfur reductase-like enzyme
MNPPSDRRRLLTASGALAAAAALGAAFAWDSARASAMSGARPRRVVVVGGGWGGLSAARHLRALAPELEVVLLERNPLFQSLPLSNKWLANLVDGRLLTWDTQAAAKAFGYAFVRTEVSAIDRERRRVLSSAGTFDYDWLVLACGIGEDFGAWFGEDRSAADHARQHYPSAFQAGDELAILKRKLDGFAGGDLLLNIPPPPYRCPPAPYERAMLIAWLFKSRGIKARLILLDPGAGILGFPRLFAERFREQITYVPYAPVKSVDPFKRIVTTDLHDYRFDDAILMPPQRAGALAWQAGLIGRDAQGRPTGWADQHPLRLHAMGDERVFLVGDLIGTASPLFGHYTKSGHVAARLGRIAAGEIAARARGLEAPLSLPESVCHVMSSVDPAESIRIEASYRQRGDGLIVQSVKQHRDPQPRGEDEAWAQGLFAELFGR